MTIEERRNLSKARFDRARDCLHTAKVNREISDYRAAANRSYYAIFHSMRAVVDHLTAQGVAVSLEDTEGAEA